MRTVARGEGADRFVVALRLALLGAEIFDCFVIEQAVDGAADRFVVDFVHLPLKLRAPFGDPAREGDVEATIASVAATSPAPNFTKKMMQMRGQLDQRRADVEQQEVEHHVDALRPALDDLGQRSGAPLQMEAQRQVVDMSEDLARQPPCRVLADLLE